MQATIHSVRDAVLSRAEALSSHEPDFARFLKTATLAGAAEDLAGLSPDWLEAVLRRTYAHVCNYTGAASSVILTPPETASAPLVIDIISPDMPFIVDSALAAVRAAGGTIRLFAHPVIHYDGRALSVLHIHSDPVADLGVMQAELDGTMADVGRAVADWQNMLERVRAAAKELSASPAKTRDEAVLFLDWLAENNFTFLGARQYRLDGAQLAPLPETGLGIMADPALKVLRSGAEFVETTPAHTDFMASAEPLLITKANIRARVHRRQHLDYVGVKLYGADGKATGELRIVGLFTSQAMATPHSEVPIIRRKLGEVMRRSGVDPQGHDGRALLSALDSYPRDELFQVTTDELLEFTTAIAGLYDRPRVRVLPRIDRFDNFVSILVFVPRDRYDSAARSRIAQYLAQQYDGRISAYYPHFPEGDLVRLHVIIGRVAGATPRPSRAELEARVEELTATFGDMLVAAAPDPATVSDYRNAFSQAYQSRHGSAEALEDIAILRTLADGARIAIRLHNRTGGDGALGLKFYHHGSAIPLSDRVPMLEAFGFRVIDERTYTLTPRDGTERYIHDLVLARADGKAFDMAALGPPVETGLLAVWEGRAESDGLNALVLTAGLGWHDAALLRALSRYLRQIGISYSQRYIAQVLVTQSAAAAALIRVFDARLNPAQTGNADAARAEIDTALEAMASLDEDTIIRRFLNLVESALRTNIWQHDAEGNARPALSIKFDSAKVDGMVAPRPFREIFVYSPRVEGIHMRFGAIARGGIRWSDRPEDFRTEVLGLVKAQQVKNAVIVPVGAKGGFVPKHLVAGMPREAFAAEGVASYKIFIGALLDITDNLVGNDVVPPKDTIRIDGNDPYLVVAADKGTASFSNTANAIAIERGYWLGDAFASGGSAGYDHKEMGITARGGWEAVKRHFREIDRDIQKQPFTVVGVGDMSGDVFGNGMLLSPEIRLLAAFDHRDIFIDPNPNAAASLAERHRLFELPRSSWQDYKAPISEGGGIFSRSLKAIPLSPQMQALLGLAGAHATPAEVMSAILRADVDLLWFGGIGTYVRATAESNLAVGDRANDAVRVTASQLRAKVVGEGANLGTTQLARVEYALAGGRINSDAIDNSAGVNSSDLEVNIKIALQPLLADGTFAMEERNAFLASMTDEVAALCLRNNYLQPLAISLAQRAGLAELPDQRELMARLEVRGLLDRAVEFLPTDAALDARAAAGQALTRPELAVLLAYAKLTLYADLLNDGELDDDYLAGELFRYFPETLHTTYPHAVETHRLRREVIATVLANAMINRGGPAYVTELTSATSASAGEIALAYAATRDIYGLTEINTAIDGLDGAVGGEVQLSLYAAVEALLRQETLWFLRNADVTKGLTALVSRHADAVASLKTLLATTLPAPLATAVGNTAQALVVQKVPAATAQRIAELGVLSFASDIALVSERSNVPVADAAEAFFAVLAQFSLWPVIEQGRTLVLSDRFERMALDRALANLLRAQRDLTADVLAAGGGSIAERITAWKAGTPGVERSALSVGELTQGTLTVSRLSVAAGLLADLAQAS
ncbi:MAG: NAD-glutamate dehydrogenase [Devosia sp.]|uniref:NAD-glutamate dehydrogenase n=1 Tax=Devosia sp. TaxID=1871048 RepID=UPI00260E5828|nr:NAD-glutamate dehydrogenase [Devosia sp.]MDB5586805.1 NAD-glutamate dehydrogenase [Devosia sp.]